MKEYIVKRLEELRNIMKANNIDAFYLDNNDRHSSEYVNNYYKERTFMSSFDGSNGQMIVTDSSAYLWTDGRYFLQAEKDLAGTTINLMKMGEENVPTQISFINDNLKNKTLAFNGELVSTSFINAISKDVNLIYNSTIISEMMKKEINNSLSFSNIWFLENKYSGETIKSKLTRVKEELKKNNLDSFVLSSLDDIAWLFNLRGSDIPSNPVFFSFAYISLKKTIIFLNESSLSETSKDALLKNKVEIKDYFSFNEFLLSLKNEKILIDESKMNYSYTVNLKLNNEVVNKMNITTLMKCIKNKTESKNNESVHIIDGVAILRIMKYLNDNYLVNPLDEWKVSETLLNYRKQSDLFFDVSFDTISGWKENGAIIHYEPTKDNYSNITTDSFLLVDSGGQYYGGTTDITRTFALGNITDEMKFHYTLVLKSMIDVSMATFKKDATGRNIDMLARENMWANGLDYNHGTGHGVGYMLNVHEGPNGIRWKGVPERSDGSILLPGMVQSIEPGLYFKNKYGIRIENEIEVVNAYKNEYGEFYKFKTLTCAPIDLKPVNKKMLTKEEIKWLNDYHKNVYKKLSKLVDSGELGYLKEVTRKL